MLEWKNKNVIQRHCSNHTNVSLPVNLQFILRILLKDNRCDFTSVCVVVEASEIAQARLKGLDQQSAAHAQQTQRPHKDVNTFINNQLKFPPSQPATNTIPPDQMKCNILKAKAEQQHKYVNGKGPCTANECDVALRVCATPNECDVALRVRAH